MLILLRPLGKLDLHFQSYEIKFFMRVKTKRASAKRGESVPVSPNRAGHIFSKTNCFIVIFDNSEVSY